MKVWNFDTLECKEVVANASHLVVPRLQCIINLRCLSRDVDRIVVLESRQSWTRLLAGSRLRWGRNTSSVRTEIPIVHIGNAS